MLESLTALLLLLPQADAGQVAAAPGEPVSVVVAESVPGEVKLLHQPYNSIEAHQPYN